MKVVSPFIRIFLLKTIWSFRVLFAGGRFSRAQYLCRGLFSGALRYWRVLEFSYILDRLPKQKGLKVLDISSPKILSFYLAHKYGQDVTGIDIWEEEIIFWRDILKRVDSSGTLAAHVELRVEDGTCLSLDDESFDCVYSVSAIEHFDDSGDTKALQEISRILKTGGIAVITVPYSEKGHDVFKSEDVYHKKFSSAPVFYERWYDQEMLKERLLKDSGLELVDFRLGYEKYICLHHKVITKSYKLPYPIRILWNAFEPFLGPLNLRATSELSKRKEGVALLTLRKTKEK
jgi:SAM-dependent methyltransferase